MKKGYRQQLPDRDPQELKNGLIRFNVGQR